MDSGQILPSRSPHSAPFIFEKKKQGGVLWLCIDCRFFNSNTVTNSWLMPRIDKLLAQLKGDHSFSKLDLRDDSHKTQLPQ